MHLDIGKAKGRENNGSFEHNHIGGGSIANNIDSKAGDWFEAIPKRVHKLSHSIDPNIRAGRSAQAQNWQHRVQCVGYLVI